ncbi:MAG: M48 family metallopeptidase [Verrucomicrobia bacterium]|nr:M48 family metallopeptidase [Verrucomicrobiota bacterium]
MSQEDIAYLANASHPSLGDGSVPGKLFTAEHALRFECEQGTIELPYTDLEIAFGTRKDPRVTFTHPEHENCELVAANEDILGAPPIRSRNNLRQQIREKEEQREGVKRIALTFAFFAVFIGGSALAGAGIEWALPRLIEHVPVSFEKKLGEEVADEVRAEFKVSKDTNITAQLDAIVQRLVKTQPKSEYQFRVAVIESRDPNAFALPGGNIFVNKGLLLLMTDSVEVAGVLSHEIAHVTRRHGCRTLITSVGPSYAISFVFGDNHGMLNVLAQSSRALVGQSFSRDFEREADETGYEMMLAANLDPRGLEQGLKRLRDLEERMFGGRSGNRAFSSHPPTPERIERLAEKWKTTKKQTGFNTLEPIQLPQPPGGQRPDVSELFK